MKILFVIIILATSYTCKAQQDQANIETEIIGTWVCEEDTNWKMEFTTNGNCYWYYTNEDTDTLTYSITTQCNGQTLTKSNDMFLKFIDSKDNDTYCHFLNGIHTDENGVKTLSTMSERGKLYLFTKQ